MNPSQPGRSQPIVPAVDPEKTIAARRAATLLTTASGGRGEVRVWAPDRQALRRAIIQRTGLLFGLGAIAFALIHLFHMWLGIGSLAGWVSGLYLPAAVLVMLTGAYVRPRYATTDDEGLAFITWRGSRSFRWPEIMEVDFSLPGEVTFRRSSGKPLVLCWLGYQPKDKARLRELIVARANLIAADTKGLYRRSAVELASVSERSGELTGGGGALS